MLVMNQIMDLPVDKLDAEEIMATFPPHDIVNKPSELTTMYNCLN